MALERNGALQMARIELHLVLHSTARNTLADAPKKAGEALTFVFPPHSKLRIQKRLL